MSLTSGLKCPRTPLRRFLDREMSAGPKPLREDFRARHADVPVLWPLPGAGTGAGTVGTAIDQRLRLAFTAAHPVDLPTRFGVDTARQMGSRAGERMGAVGDQLLERLVDVVHDLDLDNRDRPVDRFWQEEQHLARLLLAAAWYQVATRNAFGFTHTPLYLAASEAPKTFTLDRLLALPHRDLVDDTHGQLVLAATSPLAKLRTASDPARCTGGVLFSGIDITADADLLAGGTLIEIKSTRHPRRFEQHTAWQILGYLLLDHADHHRIDTVGLYLTRTATLATWTVEDCLALLGARCRDLPRLRATFAELLANCTADREPLERCEEHRVQRLLERLATPAPAGHCQVCAQTMPAAGAGRSARFCTDWCTRRAPGLHRRGWLSAPLPDLSIVGDDRPLFLRQQLRGRHRESGAAPQLRAESDLPQRPLGGGGQDDGPATARPATATYPHPCEPDQALLETTARLYDCLVQYAADLDASFARADAYGQPGPGSVTDRARADEVAQYLAEVTGAYLAAG
ncbi:hypothetical protein ACWGB8_26455 [Kitasatospora sp. NPDC054939]